MCNSHNDVVVAGKVIEERDLPSRFCRKIVCMFFCMFGKETSINTIPLKAQ